MDRKGFTLIEILVVSSVGAVLMMAMFQTIVVQQRGFTVQGATMDARQTLRAGMEVLATELREVSSLGGDILDIDPDSIRVRSADNIALVCAVSSSNPVVTVRSLGSTFGVGDSVFVFADNDVQAAADDVWLNGRIAAVDTTATCGGQPAQALTLGTGLAAAAAVDSIRVGAPVRNYTSYGFGLTSSPKGWYLSRFSGTGSSRIVGPLEGPGSGLEFAYRNEFGAITAVPADVRQITVTLRAQRSAQRADGTFVADSLTTTIHLRN